MNSKSKLGRNVQNFFKKKVTKWRPLFYIEFIFDLRECWSQRAPEWMANEELEKAFQKVYNLLFLKSVVLI